MRAADEEARGIDLLSIEIGEPLDERSIDSVRVGMEFRIQGGNKGGIVSEQKRLPIRAVHGQLQALKGVFGHGNERHIGRVPRVQGDLDYQTSVPFAGEDGIKVVAGAVPVFASIVVVFEVTLEGALYGQAGGGLAHARLHDKQIGGDLCSLEGGTQGEGTGPHTQDEVVVGDPCGNGYDGQADQRGQQDQTAQLLADGNAHLDHGRTRGRMVGGESAEEASELATG